MALLFNDAWTREQVIVVEERVGVICKWNWVIFHCAGELRSSGEICDFECRGYGST